MAQDFGDEAGESLRRMLGRAVSYAIRDWMRERDYQRRLQEQERDTDRGEAGNAEGSDLPDVGKQPDEVYLPFGEADEARRFTDLCREKGIDMTALTDADGRGFIRFAPADLERVQDMAPDFVQLLTRLQIERVTKALGAEPVTAEKVKELTEIEKSPSPSHNAPAREAPERVDSHTDRIAAEVRAVRPQCKTLDELERALAARGIGTTVSKDGEVMFYEPRIGEDGNFLPYSHEQRDWAVGARTLKERYGVDASHDSFIRNDRSAREQPGRSEPQVTDGSLDADGRTPDLNQGIESHDGMDTDVSTLRLEREQNGTDVAPSEVREEAARSREDDLSLDSVAKECRAASKQLERESGITDRELDISDKLNPVR